MDKAKEVAVTVWPTPKTIKGFLGFVNFYRRFIMGISSISNPLTSLLKSVPSNGHGTKQLIEPSLSSFTK